MAGGSRMRFKFSINASGMRLLVVSSPFGPAVSDCPVAFFASNECV